MKNILFTIIILIGLISCLVKAQANTDKQRNRNRGRSVRARNKSKNGNCHLKAIDSCLEKIEVISNNRSSVGLIKTEAGIDQLCKVATDTIDCSKGYMKRCSTPLHKELFDFFIDGVVKSMDQFCKPGPIRKSFLQHSPCMHDRVLQKPEYKTKCVDNFLATIDKITQVENIDDRLDTACCGFNRWEECTYTLVQKECGMEARKSMNYFVEKAFGDVASNLCTDAAFNFKSGKCRKLYAPQGSKPRGKNSDNPITKYLVTFMGFLF